MNALAIFLGVVGIPQIILIAVIVLLLFGGKKIPELMKGIGSGIKEFKKAANDDQPANSKKEEEAKVGEELYSKLKQTGISTILDDRINARFGFKMSDFELLGFPYAVVIGKKLEDGLVEIVDRKTLEKIDVKVDEVISKILELIK